MLLNGLSLESWWWRVRNAPAGKHAPAPERPVRRLTGQAEIIEFTSYLANRR